MLFMSNYFSNTEKKKNLYIHLSVLFTGQSLQRPKSAKKVRPTQNTYLYWHEGSRSKFKPKIKKIFFLGIQRSFDCVFY